MAQNCVIISNPITVLMHLNFISTVWISVGYRHRMHSSTWWGGGPGDLSEPLRDMPSTCKDSCVVRCYYYLKYKDG